VDRIGAEARREADLASIEPGRFTEFGDEDKEETAVVYGERVTSAGVMENVFLQRRLATGGVEVVVAERGEQVQSDDPDTRFLVLHNGRRYEGVPGTGNFRVVEFAEHGIPYRLPSLEPGEPEPRQMPVSALLRSTELTEIAEFQWRIGVPLSTVILGFLAVPLSRSRPREGRYGRLAIGLLVFIIYFNMLSAAKAWIEQGTIAPQLGLWCVHGGVVLIGLMLLALQNGWHRRMLT
jgi:lipopolysaccharide export system permease protein